MCGIVGKLNLNSKPVTAAEIKSMGRAIGHRGPDDEGIWTKGPVGLGNRRLSIIDLSPAGHQPLSNEDKTVWITFNGEIYNFQELRTKLIKQGHRFRSKTDTETIVHLWEEYGVNCLKYLRGMFAFALWDDRQKILFLARDRSGKKPLKYYSDCHSLIFASEIKALLQVKNINSEPDPIAIDHYFSLEAVPAPLTGFKQIKKLPAASYLIVKNNRVRIKKYWQLNFLPKIKADEPALAKTVLEQLTEAVKLRLIADVPIGAFLSGGVDSSAVVALMSRLGQKQINTFSVGFTDQKYSELKYARIVANQFVTNHHEIILQPSHFRLLPQLAAAYEEPYGDPSALPTFLVSQLASQSLKVVLNGDGGDDSFAGYQRYQKFGSLNLAARLLPPWSRHLAKNLLSRRWPTLADLISQPGFGDYSSAYLGLNAPLNFKQQLYQPNFFHSVDPLSSQKLFDSVSQPNLSPLDNVLLADINIYLSQVLLPKVDIASMANSLEVRSPFLDQELMQLAAKIPTNLKLKNGMGKYILKKSLEGILPKEIIYRQKMGFGFPLGSWLRHEWRPKIKELLLDPQAKYCRYLQPATVKNMIENPQTGEHFDRRLWRVLMLELWLQHYFPKR